MLNVVITTTERNEESNFMCVNCIGNNASKFTHISNI